MTKKEMLDYMEKIGCVVDFDRKYLMRKDKEYLTRLYGYVVKYAERHGLK